MFNWSFSHWLAGDDGLFLPSAQYRQNQASQILILEHGRNPSTDYYLTPRFAAHGDLPVQLIDISTTQPNRVSIPDGAFIIIVRYLTSDWAKQLLEYQSKLAGVAYFMDDDLPAAGRSPHLPLRYRHKIQRLYYRQRKYLSRLCSQVWVSTPYLADKYAIAKPTVLPPAPLVTSKDEQAPLVYFYHGTASHQAEFEWLREIVVHVQQQDTRLTFMTIGNEKVRRVFSSIPRVLVLHPMSWECYRDSLTAIPHHIGLAPLLPSKFNQGRSHTKFFDITRLGAAGIYTNTNPYSGFVRADIDGILLSNEPAAWQQSILKLAESAQLRKQIVSHARERVDELCNLTSGDLPG